MAFSLDTLGYVLFGSSNRLRLAAWIYDQEVAFYQSEIDDGLGKSTEITRHLERLAQLGMIEPCQRVAGDNRVWWRRLDSPFWGIIAVAIAAVDSDATASK